MKIIRKQSLAMVGALVLAATLLVPVATATPAQPEITDVSGDSISRKDSRDLTGAYFHTETNDSFMVSLNLTSLESYTNPGDLPDVPTTEYEVYFSLSDDNFAVACRVPVHGPLGFTIQFDIRSVSYGNNTTVEASLSTLAGCTYSVSEHLITYMVAKTHFTNLTAGTHLTKTWAAVYSKNFQDPERHIEDRGPNSGYGKDYVIRGTSGTEILDVKLTAENATQPCAPNAPAEFKITVYNAGTSQVTVDFFNGTLEETGWIVVLGLETNVTLLSNATRTLTVTVTCPRNAANRTTVTVSVYGKVRAGSQNATTNIVYLTATVNYIPPKPAAEQWYQPILNFFKKPTMWTYALIVLIVAAIVGGGATVAYSRRKRRREEEAALPAPAPVPAK